MSKAIIDKIIHSYLSRKLLAFAVVTGVTIYSIKTGSSVPDGFFHVSIAYVGSQAFVDAATGYKGA